VLAAQGLAPETVLLSRIKRHLREELARLPNYTCLETISRFRDDPKLHLRSYGGLTPLDTVRLEVVYTGRREWYGAPGAKNLSTDNPVRFIGGGMMSNGAFAYTLNNIVEGGTFTYRGEEAVDGRTAARFDFRLPRTERTLTIAIRGSAGAGGAASAGEEGSMWADPKSLDLIRVESHAVEIPQVLRLREAGMSVDYARTRIGDSEALLAQAADSRMLDATGTGSFNYMEFTHCRSYAATSVVRFDSEAEGAASTPAPVLTGPSLPAQLEVTMVLATSISDRDAAGASIEGRISGNVVHRGKVVLPDGAVVRGRIRRLERSAERRETAIDLEFTEVGVRGDSLPFYADLVRIDKEPRIQIQVSRRILVRGPRSAQAADLAVTLPELPGVASLLVKGESLTLPAGVRLVWRTRSVK